jgi:hypothetical protein
MESIPTTEISMSIVDQEMVLAHFIVSDDVERSRRFYTDALGGKTVIATPGSLPSHAACPTAHQRSRCSYVK